MIQLIKKELSDFFSSTIGFITLSIFLLINGLFLWVFDNPLNIIYSSFANLSSFFEFTPWLLIIVVPAVCMKSFSDEYNFGTIELLLTKPISIFELVLGKFLSALLILLFAVTSTVSYLYTVWHLANPKGDISLSVIISSYLGLILLISFFISISIFCSSLTKNQLSSFLISLFICLIFYFGLEELKLISISAYANYTNINKGLIDTRNIIYFTTLTLLFLYLTLLNVKHNQQ